MRQFGLHQQCPPPLRDTRVDPHWCHLRVVRYCPDKRKSFVDMWEEKEHNVLMEEQPYDHANYMDYLRWYTWSTHIRLCTLKLSNGHKDWASGSEQSAIDDAADPLCASQLWYTPRAHLIHSVTDKLTALAKEATSQKGCSRGDCHAFVEWVTKTCVEIVGELMDRYFATSLM